METMMLFLTALAWLGVGYYTFAWACAWIVILCGHGDKIKVRAAAVILPAVCWAWLLAGWLA